MNNSEYRAHLYLKGIGYAADQVENLRDEIQYMQDLTQEKDLTADRVQSSGVGNPTEQRAFKVIALREKLDEQITELLEYRTEAIGIMGEAKLTKEEHKILRLRYFETTGGRTLTWEQIADMTGYSLKHTYKIRRQALRKVAAALEVSR